MPQLISAARQNGRILALPQCRWPDRARPSDEDLLNNYRATRSQAAFSALVERHGLMVIRLCRSILGNAADAEDIAQAVFLELARRPESVRSRVGGWLHETARGRAINELRGRRRRVQREELAGSRPASTLDDDGSDLREELDVALNQLRTRLRQAVVLRYVEGRSVAEAAQAAGCPPGTMGRRSQEGLRQLRTILTRRAAALVTGLLAALTAHAKLAVAAVVVAAGVGLTLPPLLQPKSAQVDFKALPGWPEQGIVTVKGIDLPFKGVVENSAQVYYQVQVPTQTRGPMPITIGVPKKTPPEKVNAYIQDRANTLLGGVGIPLPY